MSDKTTKTDFEFLIKYLQDRGVKVTIDRNPSPEKIAYIKQQIEKKRALGIG